MRVASSIAPRSGPYGLRWEEPDVDVEVSREQTGLTEQRYRRFIRDLLRLPGLYEVVVMPGVAEEEVSGAPGDDDEDAGGSPPLAPPPQDGPGASKAAWRDYASAAGVQLPDGTSRDAIIAALKDAGVPVTQ